MAAAPAVGLVSLSSSAVITSIFCFFSLLQQSIGVSICGPSSCGGGGSLDPTQVRFPFRLRTKQDDPRCAYSPDFDLFCDGLGQTIFTLPGAGNFAVTGIDYQSKTILLNDLGSCLPRRLLDNSSLLSGGPVFGPRFPRKFMLLNCSAEAVDTVVLQRALIISCLSEGNFTVISVPSRWYDSSHGCHELGDIIFPVPMPYWYAPDSIMRLTWSEPDCSSCEERGGLCGFKNDNGSVIGCTSLSSSGNQNSHFPSQFIIFFPGK